MELIKCLNCDKVHKKKLNTNYKKGQKSSILCLFCNRIFTKQNLFDTHRQLCGQKPAVMQGEETAVLATGNVTANAVLHKEITRLSAAVEQLASHVLKLEYEQSLFRPHMYFITSKPYSGKVYIGVGKNPSRYFQQLQSTCGDVLTFHYISQKYDRTELERILQNIYGKYSMQDGWLLMEWTQLQLLINSLLI